MSVSYQILQCIGSRKWLMRENTSLVTCVCHEWNDSWKLEVLEWIEDRQIYILSKKLKKPLRQPERDGHRFCSITLHPFIESTNNSILTCGLDQSLLRLSWLRQAPLLRLNFPCLARRLHWPWASPWWFFLLPEVLEKWLL
jgi:hypothetical protein